MEMFKCLTLLTCLFSSKCVECAQFYPFGENANDNVYDPTTSSVTLTASSELIIFGLQTRSTIVFGGGLMTFGNGAFSVYQSDVDIRSSGHIWYRESNNVSLLQQAQNDIRMSFVSGTFVPTFLFIATWEEVPAGPARSGIVLSSGVNTFQCVLMSGGEESYVMYIYKDIQWSLLGSGHSQVGVSRFSHPNSGKPELDDIENTTNVGIPGVWQFRVDGQGGPVEPPLPPPTTPPSCRDLVIIRPNLM